MELADPLQELLLAPGLEMVLDLVALGLEVVDGAGRNVLEQEDLDLF